MVGDGGGDGINDAPALAGERRDCYGDWDGCRDGGGWRDAW